MKCNQSEKRVEAPYARNAIECNEKIASSIFAAPKAVRESC